MSGLVVTRRGHRLSRRLAALLAMAALMSVVLGTIPVSAALPEPTVVGGQAVPDGKYPFQAGLLGLTFGEDDFQRQYCGGTLISPVHVLTAAHCVAIVGNGPDDFLRRRDFRVVIGRTVLTSDQGVRRRAVGIAMHPRYEAETLRFDVAVVTLRKAVEGVTPMALVTPGTDALERPGTRAIATGWGNTVAQIPGPGSGGIHYPDRLREVRVPLVSREECVNAYTVDGTTFVYPSVMICAGRTGKDTCQGDSGGPLFVPAVTGGFIQLAVTSWGNGCAATGWPGVYTRLSNRNIGNFILSVTGGQPV